MKAHCNNYYKTWVMDFDLFPVFVPTFLLNFSKKQKKNYPSKVLNTSQVENTKVQINKEPKIPNESRSAGIKLHFPYIYI